MSFNLEMKRFLCVILLHTLLLENDFITQRQLKNSVQKISMYGNDGHHSILLLIDG